MGFAANTHRTVSPVEPTSSLQTPPNAHCLQSSNTSGLGSRSTAKKVGFSAEAEYKEPPVYPEGAVLKHRPTPVSLPSSTSKPGKSILKQTSHTITESTLGSGPAPLSSTMLESTLRQLAGTDRDSKVDAYMMLTRALKDSDALPDRAALNDRMNSFVQFIQRDITVKPTSGSPDISLVNYALGLLILFLRLPGLARSFSEDHAACIVLVDHCIRSFEDPAAPKEVVRNLMQVIANQNFSLKVMTSDRVGRLVSALHNIEEHLNGKSIILSRVLVYRKLVSQVKQPMINHSDWLLDLFTDMLSNIIDIRTNAVALGLDAGFLLNHDRALSRRVMEITALTFQDKRYIDYYREKLRIMLKDRRQAPAVPRIWSVVMLLVRCPFDKWDAFNDWLLVIQACFNSSDFQTRLEANQAWARLVYIALSDERIISDAKRRLSTLRRPFADQMNRKGTGKQSEDLRKAVLGGVCNLFYYAFRPNVSLALVDHYWDSGVAPTMRDLMDRSCEDTIDYGVYAAQILTNLFNCSRTRIWTRERVTDPRLVEPTELPAIDSKWIRRNVSRVFDVVEPILEKNFLALRSKSPTLDLWQALVSSVASAAIKEVKVATDTAAFVARSFNFLQSVWATGVPPGEAGDYSANFLCAVRTYLQVMFEALGQLPFTEKILSTNDQNKFVPISTPSHRMHKAQSQPKAPLAHLFSFISTLPPGVPDDDAFADFIRVVFNPSFKSRLERTQVELAAQFSFLVPVDALCPFGTWALVADWSWSLLKARRLDDQSLGPGGSNPVGQRYRDFVKVLERGLRSTPNLPHHQWLACFDEFVGLCQEEAGDACVAIIAVEPLAQICLELDSSGQSKDPIRTLSILRGLLTVAAHPRDRQAVDAARRRLWGTAAAGSRPNLLDPFDHLYRLTKLALKVLYAAPLPSMSEVAQGILQALCGFLQRSNRQLLLQTLVAIQEGVALWLQDAQKLLTSQSGEAFSSVWQSRLDARNDLLTSTELVTRSSYSGTASCILPWKLASPNS